MKREFISYFGLLMDGVKPYVLRGVYRELTRDASVLRMTSEEEVDERVKEVLASEDSYRYIIDLRELNEGQKSKYDVFWDKCTEYTFKNVQLYRKDGMEMFVLWQQPFQSGTLYIAQVTKKCLPGTPIPSKF